MVRNRVAILAAVPAHLDAYRNQPRRRRRSAALAVAAVAQRPAAQEHRCADHRLHLVQPDRPGRLGPGNDRRARRGVSGGPVRSEPRPAAGRSFVQASDRHASRPAGISGEQGAEGTARMIGLSAAHGDDPGPTQRPLLAGAISGVLATIPAIAILYAFGSLAIEARILGLSELLTISVGLPVMAAAGAVYSQVFGRAANDVRGGWLFGMAFG